VTPPADAGQAAALAQALALPVPIATVLVSRGQLDAEPTTRFLNPRLSDLGDPDTLPDMAAAVARLWLAVDRRERILVFGDYDVDGICSTALMTQVLRAVGASVDAFLPNRVEHGYGLSVAGLQEALRLYGPAVVVTVDCGTGSREAVGLARERGIDVIVTDHHEPDGEVAPALAVVNPKLAAGHAGATLAGVGVAFKLCHALIKRGLHEGRAAAGAVDLRQFLDLVAVATVADVVPLVGENRILVSHGVRKLNLSPQTGLRALIEVAGLKQRRQLDCYHIGFVLGPRLNAAGRIGDANGALQLLLCDRPEVAAGLAGELNLANQERKTLEDGMLQDAQAEIDAHFQADRVFGLVVGRAGWHLGTAGIVASRLVSRYARPAVVLAVDEDGRARGSCRSVESLDVLEALRECAPLLERFGGHKMAAGVEVQVERLEAFRERFNAACRDRLAGQDLRPVQTVDAWIGLAEADERLLGGLERLQPLGNGNPEPNWGVRRVRLAAEPRRVGKDQRHLRLVVTQGASQIEAVGFNLGMYEVPPGELDLVFRLRENWYQGRGGVELEICDLRAAVAVKSVAPPAA
jgi:single-stranded-DNA-specific exonuclease